ncbi:hypothetical protein [Carboxylicivirga sp. RSCT41]|uniref:hypothetical protein n=1 Tax=Carboxylicivirga agarovorans TaxID=3417570 RepID=UPI003D345838
MKRQLTLLIGFIMFVNVIIAQSKDELATQLANPVASLISVPFQSNFDYGVGPNEGFKYTLNAQPVIPVSIGENWNMISRTIVPIISQNDVIADGSSQSGMGDIVQSLFFSPKAPTPGGLVWGVGPVLMFPTATNSDVGLEKWAIGPTIVALKLSETLIYGVLANHLVSYAGNEDRTDVNATFFQPFISKTVGKGLSVSLASENTQNWDADLIFGFTGIYANQIIRIRKQLIQVGGGPKMIYSNKSKTDWGFRINLVLLFPKSN